MNACSKCFHSFTLLKHIACESSKRLIDTSAAPTGTTDSRLSQTWKRLKHKCQNSKKHLAIGPSCQNHTSVTRGVDSPEPLVYSGLQWSVGAWQLFNWRCTSKMNRSCSSWNWHKKQPKITQEQEVWLIDWYDFHDFHHLNTCNMVIFTLQVWQASFCSMVCVTLGLPRFQPNWTHFHRSQCSMEWHQSRLRYACKWCSLQSKNHAYNTLHKECSEKCQSRVWTPMLSFLVCAHSSPITAGSAFAKMKLYPIACMKPEGQRGSTFQIHKLQRFGLLSLLPLHAPQIAAGSMQPQQPLRFSARSICHFPLRSGRVATPAMRLHPHRKQESSASSFPLRNAEKQVSWTWESFSNFEFIFSS